MTDKLTDEHRYYGDVFTYVDEEGNARISAPAESHRAVSLQQSEAYRKLAEGRKHTFFWNGMERLDYVIESLTFAQCGYLLVLASYMNYDGMLVKSEKNTEPMTTADMKKVLKLTRKQSTFYDFLNACIDYGIMAEHGGSYYVTRRFHFRGETGGERVVKTIITQLRDMYRDVSAHDIGLLYRMIPYVHRDSNILCSNPEERSSKRVAKLNRKQLAEVVGVTPYVISTSVNRMVYDGKSVFAKVTTATDGTFYMLNPKVFRRAERDYDETTKGIFGLD